MDVKGNEVVIIEKALRKWKGDGLVSDGLSKNCRGISIGLRGLLGAKNLWHL
jgi:hypothetical protein